MREEYPNGVPGYIDWNASNQQETIRRADHLSQYPEIIELAASQHNFNQQLDNDKVLGLVGAAELVGGLFALNYLKWWLRSERAGGR